MIQPLNDRVVVLPDEVETVTKSGFVIPDTASRERPQTGKVLSVGPQATVKTGDTVIFGRYAGDDFPLKEDGKNVTLRILHSDSLLGILV